ncbi:MAG: TetR family transcriptional regulator [Alphaproteobacteria bacterium]|nr:TetR family transcriptional regulator [Alphaproteobacteria bacterium]
MKRTKEEALETRQAILQSALDLFYQKGYSKTTFEEIATRINLTKGAVYWNFKNKPDLVIALINAYVEKKKKYLEQKVAFLKHFKDIETYFLATTDFILGDENALKLAFFLSLQMEWSETIITKVLENMSQNTASSFEYIKTALVNMQKNGDIRTDIDVQILTSILFNTWCGHLEAYLSKKCSIDLKTMVQKSFDVLLNGLKRKD